MGASPNPVGGHCAQTGGESYSQLSSHIFMSPTVSHRHTLGVAISGSNVVHRPLWLTEKLAGLATGHEVVAEEIVGNPQQHRPQPHFFFW